MDSKCIWIQKSLAIFDVKKYFSLFFTLRTFLLTWQQTTVVVRNEIVSIV